jgi:uncharacterized protein (TIGR00297 family)
LIVVDQVALNFAIGAAASAILAAIAIRTKSLSVNGGLGAFIIGTLIFGYGGLAWYVVLLAFFLSSSALTRFGYSSKAAKGVGELRAGARGIWQTIGQGGIAAIIAAAALFFRNNPTMMAVGFASALAEANADTWAVELGVLSKRNPKLITRLSKEVSPGTSGGISIIGELSAVAGSVLIALVGGPLGILGNKSLVLFMVVAFTAILGEHVDSVLGATVQASYYCPTCMKQTERPIHKCGTSTQLVRGFRLLTNEAVNFMSTGVAALLALLAFFILAF